MRVTRLNSAIEPCGLSHDLKGHVAAIGNFDGVHLGHRQVIDGARALCEETGSKLAVISFEPHPREVVSPENAPARLTPLRRKIQLFRDAAVDCMFVFHFNESLMSIEAERFINDHLIKGLGLKGIVCGPDFRFGRKRAGDVALLQEHASRAGVQTKVAEPLLVEGNVCSSSRIRAALAEGEVENAAAMLGRDYSIHGIVKGGDQRGRTIGFPTANVHPIVSRFSRGKVQIPAHGVYAVTVDDRHGIRRPAVANLGRRPTFDGRTTLLEVHVIDYEGDLYGQRLDVNFVQHIRNERKFDGIAALSQQISADKDKARHILKV